EATVRSLVVGRTRSRPTRPPDCVCSRPCCLAPIRERPRGCDSLLPTAGALVREPLVELVRCACDEEAVQQIATVQLERLRGLAASERIIECARVAPELIRDDAQIFGAVSLHRVCAQGPSQKVNRLPQCAARTIAIHLGPQQGEDGISAVIAGRRGDREVCEQRQTLRLTEDREKLASVFIAQIEAAKRTKTNH